MLDPILADRRNRYEVHGDFNHFSMMAQCLKDTWRRLRPRGNRLDPDMREALDMVMHKIARVLNGDPCYSDNWRDIAGYALRVADRLDELAAKKEPGPTRHDGGPISESATYRVNEVEELPVLSGAMADYVAAAARLHRDNGHSAS